MISCLSWYTALLLLLLAAGCAVPPPSPPPLAPAVATREGSHGQSPCLAVYPVGAWQFTHRIDFSLAGGGSSSVIGVTVLKAGEIRCALMTVEGFTLFALRHTDRTEILRAVPPFDRPGFARGLLADIRTIFCPPPYRGIQHGLLADGTPCCRLEGEDGRTTDILAGTGGRAWRIRTYDADHGLSREITAQGRLLCGSYPVPRQLTLTAPGASGYTLHLTLVDAQPLGTTVPDTNTRCDSN